MVFWLMELKARDDWSYQVVLSGSNQLEDEVEVEDVIFSSDEEIDASNL